MTKAEYVALRLQVEAIQNLACVIIDQSEAVLKRLDSDAIRDGIADQVPLPIPDESGG